jgi:prepilin-type N-terminal cleavage/methylation domain-containing protein
MIIQSARFCSIKTEKMKSEGGFTLLELMLVMVVISIIASALVMPFLSNLNEGARPDIYATATQLASADLDLQRASGYASITIGTTTGSTITMNGRDYDRSITKGYVSADRADNANAFTPTGSVTDYKKVTAKVTTTNPGLEVELWTIVSPKDYTY